MTNHKIQAPRWLVPGVFLCAFILRVILIAYGDWQDRNFEVPYTDVDYRVFTDAAAYVWKGDTPFKRATYRYTPLLAWILLPNVTVHRVWGKLLFSTCDLLASYLLFSMLQKAGLPRTAACGYTCVWLLNPMVMAVSTRGNAEALLALVVLSVLHRAMAQATVSASVLLGLAIHLKMYPIIYAWPLYLHLLQPNQSWWRPTAVQWKCIFVTALTLVVLTCAMWVSYGFDYIQESILHHITRRDNRHNFSPYFYMLYLTHDTRASFLLGQLAFLPQAALVLVIGWRYSHDLPMAMFTQTVAFVAFNKVCTSQYFLWYLCLLPLVLPQARARVPDWKLAAALGGWLGAQALWLSHGYQLEFQGQPVFLRLWLCGLLLLAANGYVLLLFMAGDTRPGLAAANRRKQLAISSSSNNCTEKNK